MKKRLNEDSRYIFLMTSFLFHFFLYWRDFILSKDLSVTRGLARKIGVAQSLMAFLGIIAKVDPCIMVPMFSNGHNN